MIISYHIISYIYITFVGGYIIYHVAGVFESDADP